jgi:saccharopine dehydrogenase-like NADP-dependent oxidoreductase
MDQFKVSIVGAGNIGRELALVLSNHTDFEIGVIDCADEPLDRLKAMNLPVKVHTLCHRDDLPGLLASTSITVATVPEAILASVAAAAAKSQTHYVDFSPVRPAITDILRPLSNKRAVMQGCGVSPGIIDCVASDLAAAYSPVKDLIVRVGSVPRFPANRLGYGQIWNIDGLIDEYTQTGVAIRNRAVTSINPLEDYERISIEGISYEGFTTSNGMENLETFLNTGAENVTFKTLRYPGHLDYMRFLLDDLDLRHRRDMLRSLLMNGLALIDDDVLILAVTARGMRDRRLHEKTVVHRFQSGNSTGSSNSLTSVAAGYAATLISRLCQGELPAQGFYSHDRLSPQRVLGSAFIRDLVVS